MKKITKKEYKKFVVPKLYQERFTKEQRQSVDSAFFSDLQDKEHGEVGNFLSPTVPGISEDELTKRLEELRDPDSHISKGLKYPLYKYPEKLDKLEEIMREALEENKEGWF
ncbi:MAG: hypothetical protein WDZ40_03020 [Candidatus Spechtbacterales bacterium]